jgi:hypothetical protein
VTAPRKPGRPPKPLSPDDKRHGHYTGYGAGCRQRCCMDAFNAYQRDFRRKKRQSHETATSLGNIPERTRRRPGDDFTQGFQKTCNCGHVPGMHALAKFPSDPQPCESPGCACRNLNRPPIEKPAFVRDWGWKEGSYPTDGARRIA